MILLHLTYKAVENIRFIMIHKVHSDCIVGMELSLWRKRYAGEGTASSNVDAEHPEQGVGKEHPLRRVKLLADAALKELSATLDQMYSMTGCPSIPPKRLLKATLLMAFYTVRGERPFCEDLDYNLLFRRFLDTAWMSRASTRAAFRAIGAAVGARCGAEVLHPDSGAGARPGTD